MTSDASTASTSTAVSPRHDSPFLRACRREPVERTPIWLMRQAGRYMPEYRAVRAKVSMKELCRSPQLVAEVTTFAAVTLDVDAAILFADLLLVCEALGQKLEFAAGEGPQLTPAVRDARGVDALREGDPEALAYVYDGVRLCRAALPATMPLIGFAGAPFTVASYMVEGGSSRHFAHTKTLMYGDEGAWRALMEKIVRITSTYLARQVAAGAECLQIFDSWVGALSPADYRRYVLPYTQQLIASLPAGVPVIHFGTGTATLLGLMKAAGGDVIGLDWRVDLDAAWAALGHDVGVMGNLDPLTLLGQAPRMADQAASILAQAAGRPGHIFNLGHGVLPETPVDNAKRLVEFVHAARVQQ